MSARNRFHQRALILLSGPLANATPLVGLSGSTRASPRMLLERFSKWESSPQSEFLAVRLYPVEQKLDGEAEETRRLAAHLMEQQGGFLRFNAGQEHTSSDRTGRPWDPQQFWPKRLPSLAYDEKACGWPPEGCRRLNPTEIGWLSGAGMMLPPASSGRARPGPQRLATTLHRQLWRHAAALRGIPGSQHHHVLHEGKHRHEAHLLVSPARWRVGLVKPRRHRSKLHPLPAEELKHRQVLR